MRVPVATDDLLDQECAFQASDLLLGRSPCTEFSAAQRNSRSPSIGTAGNAGSRSTSVNENWPAGSRVPAAPEPFPQGF
jgi:hypothetical protein